MSLGRMFCQTQRPGRGRLYLIKRSVLPLSCPMAQSKAYNNERVGRIKRKMDDLGPRAALTSSRRVVVSASERGMFALIGQDVGSVGGTGGECWWYWCSLFID